MRLSIFGNGSRKQERVILILSFSILAIAGAYYGALYLIAH